jgi:hypothetical protein
MSDCMVSESNLDSKFGVHATLIQSNKIAPGNGWWKIGVRAISDNAGSGGGLYCFCKFAAFAINCPLSLPDSHC